MKMVCKRHCPQLFFFFISYRHTIIKPCLRSLSHQKLICIFRNSLLEEVYGCISAKLVALCKKKNRLRKKTKFKVTNSELMFTVEEFLCNYC